MSSGVHWSECNNAHTLSLSFGSSKITCQHSKLIQFTWQCSVDCGRGTQVRSVFCAGVDKGKYQQFPDEACPRSSKPASVQPCSSRISCKPQWFTTKWGKVQWNFIIDAIRTNDSNDRICLHQYEFLERFRITSPHVREIQELGEVWNPGFWNPEYSSRNPGSH